MQSGVHWTCLPLFPITTSPTGTLPAGEVSSTDTLNDPKESDTLFYTVP